MFTQVESQLTVKYLYDRWRPQIVHDLHQMGAQSRAHLHAALRRSVGAERGPFADLGEQRDRHPHGRPPHDRRQEGRRLQRPLRRLDAGPGLPAHPRRRSHPHRVRVGPPRDAGRSEARGPPPGIGYDAKVASWNFPNPGKAGPGGCRTSSTTRCPRPTRSSSTPPQPATSGSDLLRVNLRAASRQSPFAFVDSHRAGRSPGRGAPAHGAKDGRCRAASGAGDVRGRRAAASARAPRWC